MFGKKKKNYGIEPKQRTSQQASNEYNHHAVQAGHKMRLMKELEEEIVDHCIKMTELNHEAVQLQKREKEIAAKNPPAPAHVQSNPVVPTQAVTA